MNIHEKSLNEGVRIGMKNDDSSQLDLSHLERFEILRTNGAINKAVPTQSVPTRAFLKRTLS